MAGSEGKVVEWLGSSELQPFPSNWIHTSRKGIFRVATTKTKYKFLHFLTRVVAGCDCKGSPSGLVVASCNLSSLIKNLTSGYFSGGDSDDHITMPILL